MKLFEYAVIFVPEKDAKNDVTNITDATKPKILVQPTTVIAKDAAAVNMLAIRKIPAEYEDQLDKVQVAVRPF